MNCEAFQVQIAALVDGSLEPETRATVEAHLSGCGACRRLRADLEAMDEWLTAGVLEAEPSSAILDGLTAQLNPSLSGRVSRLGGVLVAVTSRVMGVAKWRCAAASAVALTLLSVAVLNWGGERADHRPALLSALETFTIQVGGNPFLPEENLAANPFFKWEEPGSNPFGNSEKRP